VRLVWADGGYAGKLVDYAATMLGVTVQIVNKLAGQVGFVVLHRRWCVERTFSWINRCRRTVRDYERLPEHHAAMVYWAMIIVMGRRLARHQPAGRVIPQPARALPEPVIYQALRDVSTGMRPRAFPVVPRPAGSRTVTQLDIDL
jgi:hypothetical protein